MEGQRGGPIFGTCSIDMDSEDKLGGQERLNSTYIDVWTMQEKISQKDNRRQRNRNEKRGFIAVPNCHINMATNL